MPHYSPERKEAILQKMAPPHSLTIAELASQEGVSTADHMRAKAVNWPVSLSRKLTGVSTWQQRTSRWCCTLTTAAP